MARIRFTASHFPHLTHAALSAICAPNPLTESADRIRSLPRHLALRQGQGIFLPAETALYPDGTNRTVKLHR